MLTGQCIGSIIRRFFEPARGRNGKSNRNTNMIWASYSKFTDTMRVAQSLCDHLTVTFVYGGSGSYG